MHFSAKFWLNFVGGLIAFSGVVFVILQLSEYAHQLDLTGFSFLVWLIIGLLALVYGSANILLARAWWNILSFLGINAQWGWTVKIYGLSQLAKYVPGNIFHLAGRQAFGMAIGYPKRELAKSTIWELGLIVFAGSLFGFLVLPLVWSEVPAVVSFGIFFMVSTMMLVIVNRQLSPLVSASLFWQIIFLTISGTVFTFIVSAVVPSTDIYSVFSTFCSAYIIAWLAGLVTPGAPAGVGVRELVLLFLLGGQVAEADLLLAVILGRTVTVVGDLMFFCAAYAMKIEGRYWFQRA